MFIVKTSYSVEGCEMKQDLCPPIVIQQGSGGFLGINLKYFAGSGFGSMLRTF